MCVAGSKVGGMLASSSSSLHTADGSCLQHETSRMLWPSLFSCWRS